MRLVRHALFGALRVDGILDIDDITMPVEVQKAHEDGKTVRASYQFEIAASVRFGHALWPHLEELDRNTAASKLPGGFRPSEPAADNTHDVFHGFLHRQKTIRAGREKIGARGVDPDDWTKRSA